MRAAAARRAAGRAGGAVDRRTDTAA
jgi:hypothetical protein